MEDKTQSIEIDEKCKSCTVFLDLLGFSELSKTDLLLASDILYDLNDTSNGLIELHEALSKHLKEKDSHPFDHVIPFSDSLFLSGRISWEFFVQLALFLYQSWTKRSRDYGTPQGAENPIIFDVKGNARGGSKGHQNWPPLLFRGGISFGQVTVQETKGRVNGIDKEFSNLFGLPIVSAVALEKSGKGPRIFLDKENFDRFSASILASKECQRFFLEVENKTNNYEFIWPALVFKNGFYKEDDFIKMLHGVVNLWKVHAHQTCSDHYVEFVRLMIKSAEIIGLKENRKLQDALKKSGVDWRFLSKKDLASKTLDDENVESPLWAETF